LLHREPTSQEVAGWVAFFNAGASRAVVASLFIGSAEYRSNEITGDYRNILGRDPEPGAVGAWLGAMSHGLTAQQMLVQFYASGEYYQRTGGTPQGWITGLYRDLLGRSPDAAGFSAWVAVVRGGMPLSSVANTFVYSPEEFNRQITDAYHAILGRDPDAAGISGWNRAMRNGTTLELLNTGIVASTEYATAQYGLNLPVSGAVPGQGVSTTPGQLTSSEQNNVATGQASSSSLSGTGPNTTGVTLSVGQNIDVNHEIGNQSEETLAIDPSNPSRMFIASNDNDILPGMMGAFSTDGGLTWTPRVFGDFSDTIPLTFSDPWASFDQFGNLFYSYIAVPPDLNLQNIFLAIVVSTDGGKTFSSLGTFPSQDQLGQGITNVFDHPEITTGHGGVFCTYAVLRTLPSGQTTIQIAVSAAPVTGLGKVGSFTNFLVPGSDFENFGDIIVGPNGEVMTAMQTTFTTPGPDNILISVNPAPFNGGTFSDVRFNVAAHINVGSDRFTLPSPDRSFTANIGLAWDDSNGPHRGRVYLVYQNAVDVFTNDLNIFLQHSDDNGRTWSTPVQINTDITNRTQFFPKVAVDQTTGNVAIAWYDCRNDPESFKTDIFATASLDGGVTFLPNVKVTTGQSNVVPGLPGNGANDYGDYMGLAFSNNQFHVAWADNSRTLQGNPEIPSDASFPATLDIATAAVTLVGLGGGPPNLPDDFFEPNDTPNLASNLGLLSNLQTTANLTINRHANGVADTDWFVWTASRIGTVNVSITYDNSLFGGDLQLRLFTVSTQGTLIQLGASHLTGVTTQRISVSQIFTNEPLFVFVSGVGGSIATYSLSGSLF
jgi:hypothetical protein